MRTLLALVTVAALCATAAAQDFVNAVAPIVFNRAGVSGNDKGVDLALDGSGNVYVLVSSESASEGVNFMIRKYDNNGNFVFAREFNSSGAQDDFPVALAVDTAGNAYATGYINVGGSPVGILTGKVGSDGNTKYVLRYDHTPGNLSATDLANDIACDQAGNCYVAAESFSGTSRDYVILRYTGNTPVAPAWTATSNGPGNGTDRARAIAYNNGNVLVTGVVQVTGTDTDFGTGKFSAATGAQVWFARFTAALADDGAAGFDIDANADGSKIVCVGERRVNSNQNQGMTATGIWFDAQGQRFSPAPENENLSQLLNFNNKNEDTRAVHVAMGKQFNELQGQDVGFLSYDGFPNTLNNLPNVGIGFTPPTQGNLSITTGRQWDPVATGKGEVMAGDVAAHPKGAGFLCTTAVVDTNMGDGNDQFDMVIFNTLGNGMMFVYDGGLFKDDEGAAVAIDSNQAVWAIGSTKAANDKYDMVLLKLTQRPFVARDEILLMKGASVNLPAAQGVLANDFSTVGATVVQDMTTANGTMTLATDGAITYTPNAGFSGTDPAQYHVEKAPFFNDTGTINFHVFPNVVSLDLTSPMNGDTYGGGTIALDGNEPSYFNGGPGQTQSCDPPGLVRFPYPWAGFGTTANLTLAPQYVPTDTTVTITVSRPGSSASDTALIQPGGISGIAVNPGSIVGGDNAAGSVSLAHPAGPGGRKILLSTNTSFMSVPYSVTVAEGASSANFVVTTSPVTTTAVRQIVAKGFGNQDEIAVSTKNVTLLAPIKLSALTVNPTSVHGGQNTTLTGTLTGPAPGGGANITISDNSSAINSPATLPVAGGATTGSATVGTTQVGSTATRTITGIIGGVSKTANLTIVPSPTLTNLTTAVSNLTGGQGTTATATLSGNVTVGSITVAIADNSGSISTPTSATVTSGTSLKTFNIFTSSVGSSQTRQITATLLGVVKTANLTLNPVPTLTTFTITPNPVKGGLSCTGTVTYNAPAGIGGNSTQISDNSSAITTPSSVNVLHGATQASFNITTAAVLTSQSRQVTATRSPVTKVVNLILTP